MGLKEDGLAMWWTFTQHPENRIHEAFYGFSRQPGLEAFKAHAELIHAPGLNMMYGDAEGDIVDCVGQASDPRQARQHQGCDRRKPRGQRRPRLAQL